MYPPVFRPRYPLVCLASGINSAPELNVRLHGAGIMVCGPDTDPSESFALDLPTEPLWMLVQLIHHRRHGRSEAPSSPQ